MKAKKVLRSLLIIVSIMCLVFLNAAAFGEDVPEAEGGIYTYVNERTRNFPYTPTLPFGEFPTSRGIDTVSVMKGSALFNETGKGAHYYAYSSYSGTYGEAYATIKFPTGLNNANNTRNAYIALGIAGVDHGIDMGLVNTGSGWYPFYFDVGNVFAEFPQYMAPSTATQAQITVTPETTTTVRMWINYMDSNENSVGTAFNKTITINSGNLVEQNGNIMCRYYRFASLVPKITDNQQDGSYMTGGQIADMSLYNKNTSTWDSWGIWTARVSDAWRVSPERVTVSSTNYCDTFNIRHYS